MKFLQATLLCALAVIVTHVAGQNVKDNVVTKLDPTSEDFELEIPEHCKKIGICEDVPNYPQELADKAISQLTNTGALQQDKLDIPSLPDIAQRAGAHEENIELCKSDKRVVYPKAAVGTDGKWHAVLNQEENPLQALVVEVCDPPSAPCSNVIFTQTGYETSCQQKFVYRTLQVLLRNGDISQTQLQVPSCCACVANVV
ncbi:unnamed protein product [Spodoptera littoralis]|uniref:Spaetzle domain-containing protein n=1 Tax=Spodoptera littoralis TaxID=7109 RepID=A0A9P0IIR2_SPOLI|nr:unnamed protein product [Spodoptera littoralis]CAH1646957.1 unnamed protein product [Spodoptera littoralis]